MVRVDKCFKCKGSKLPDLGVSGEIQYTMDSIHWIDGGDREPSGPHTPGAIIHSRGAFLTESCHD